MSDRYVLITNLSYVTIGQVRTCTHALLIEAWDNNYGLRPDVVMRYRLRGFGTDPAWPVFDMELSSAEYEIEPMSQPDGAGGQRASSVNFRVLLAGLPASEVRLAVDDWDQPLSVETIEGPIDDVWGILTARCAKYWKAPRMPVLEWLPANAVRQGARRR